MLRLNLRRWLGTAFVSSMLVSSVGCDDGVEPVPGCADADCSEATEMCDPQGRDDSCSPSPRGSGASTDGSMVRFADEVVEAPGHTGEGFFDSVAAANGVRGGGPGQGGFDVFSLGYDTNDCYVVLGWSGAVVLNGPGVDFAVFENSFQLAQPGHHFMDLVVVEVSRDGQTWVAFPHDYVAADESTYSKAAEDWIGFAGRTPVLLHEEDNAVDPFDVERAGGDHFDLNDLPDDGNASSEIREYGFSYIRLSSAPARANPDTGAPFVRDFISDGADIDGVYGRYVVSESSP